MGEEVLWGFVFLWVKIFVKLSDTTLATWNNLNCCLRFGGSSFVSRKYTAFSRWPGLPANNFMKILYK